MDACAMSMGQDPLPEKQDRPAEELRKPVWNRETHLRLNAETEAPGCDDGLTRGEARSRTKAFFRAAELYQAGDIPSFYEMLTVASFRNSKVSVTLANPSLPDVPLVGASRGFEEMTGYSRREILGRNCRFLSIGCKVPKEVRQQMRLATRTDRGFRGVLWNRRKNGEVFRNLLQTCWIRVGNCLYILGLQADVTHSDVDLSLQQHSDELDRLVNAIFAAHVDVWAALQLAEFNATEQIQFFPYMEQHLLPSYSPAALEEARRCFVTLGPRSVEAATRVRYSNTFIEVDDSNGQGTPTLRENARSSSAPPPSTLNDSSGIVQVSAPVLREGLSQLTGAPLLGYSTLVGDSCERGKGAEAKGHGEADPEPPPIQVAASKGSMLHPNGCTPCSFHCYSHMGCNRGTSCAYCHMDHPKRTRRRGKKKGGLRSGKEEGGEEVDIHTEDKNQDTTAVPYNDPEACDSEIRLALRPLLESLGLLSPLPPLDGPPLIEPDETGTTGYERDSGCSWLVAASNTSNAGMTDYTACSVDATWPTGAAAGEGVSTPQAVRDSAIDWVRQKECTSLEPSSDSGSKTFAETLDGFEDPSNPSEEGVSPEATSSDSWEQANLINSAIDVAPGGRAGLPTQR
eukprot:CAMPEP_0206457870 /NCGR_PEP_ID=MMETSP0324_2-20121206/23224_1 /ASSEMBLY_ACC=CAM_ASM_000836 /TAXON_ID=2866 /ORGANISM="Crypthecodinium cohnii, Strain Seligo" /LENGTH=626 /DNA_ID=CAMNT_0053929085 /DNA_START=34 /DNA_END=1914 /DNA_ORIENTATION=+